MDDEALAAELAAGREVVGLLIGIPDWARDRRNLPRGLALPRPTILPMPGASSSGEVVSRYAGRIDRWIIWNEPDILMTPMHRAARGWRHRDAFSVAAHGLSGGKAANSDAGCPSGRFHLFLGPSYFAFPRRRRRRSGSRGAQLLLRHRHGASLFPAHAVFNVLYAFRRVLDAHGLAQPIWLVGTNAPPWMILLDGG